MGAVNPDREEAAGPGVGDGLTRRSVARDASAETRETPESPQVNLPDSAAIPAEPTLEDGSDSETATETEESAAP